MSEQTSPAKAPPQSRAATRGKDEVPRSAVRRRRPPPRGHLDDIDSSGSFCWWFAPIFLFASMVLLNASMTSVERFQYVTSYPSRFTLQGFPNDLKELLVFVVPTQVKTLYKHIEHGRDPRHWDLQRWIDWEEKVAWKRLLENVHPAGTAEGCVVASPSRESPDYWYEWTRDSALVMRNLVQAYTKAGVTKHRKAIDEYIRATRIIQSEQTTIGGFYDGGLGDVKYHVDHEPFLGEWGRPQNDGPALRVITLAEFALHQLDQGTEQEIGFVKTVLYDSVLPTKSVIKGDLEHISNRWSHAGFDLWEEVSGSHFYTLLAIHRALIVGADLAQRLDDPKAASYYLQQADEISRVLEEFWSPEKGLIRVSLNQSTGRDSEENAHRGDAAYGKESELDSAILLAVLHSGQGTGWNEENDKVLSTLEKLVEVFKPIYPINERTKSASALGRYPEDRYDGLGLSVGHPWYLCTLAASEILYKNSLQLSTSHKPLLITSTNHAHYARFIPLPPSEKMSKDGLTIKAGARAIQEIARGQIKWGDEFVGIVQEYARRNGSLNEQFNRYTGEGRGARDLTWSYAAFITASQARREAKQALESGL
ncbi:BZ3500_MvSof-1268-A1-R1_Chr1-1g00875 [Microbotryum saponariae]|uniref:glucan 1,4-alpha-glucosidase n=1 Tax=Microbotryum saponariae TaxID=289078 RepID=A0A2X0KLX2_9BASI|nr:BZ3500_MvSof-1268-A1-R1_Chr1-1g00875 [Microbotryum saponariae]SCZ92828.1 BZ3501_MvSof-1269-A2-R1_Chr1-1g00472 [Microbotryum saponariae]